MEYQQPSMKKDPGPSCVVGIGASAGGLEALQQLLTFLPGNTGMAFIIIQHLAPNHKSMLADILGKYTVMPVVEATDGMAIERNHIYMIPPRYNLEIEMDRLMLKEYDHTKINHPVDVFFRSLANSYENRAVAVILSGTGSDGTNGIRTIKEKNGMIIVQNPDSCKFDGMPRSAISTGFVDLIQNPDSIAREMAHISSSISRTQEHLEMTDQDMMTKIFSILKSVTNINYAYYKQTTILRRIERRMVITHNRNLKEYLSYITNNPEEAKLLSKEVLIGVTSFFRDGDYFDVLKERVIKPLVESAPVRPLRVWVAGCSTGEEAYSIAILFTEAMEELNIRREIKIFATDLDNDAINVAGRGIYGDNIIDDVSVTRLSRYFTRKGNKYVVRHDIRKMIIFAQHNVFQDPPFGKLDLICCRNLLIYFQSVLQRNLFAIFHSALNDKGYLFLGRSESVIDYNDIFKTLCVNEKIFVHNSSGRLPANHQYNYSMRTAENDFETPIVPDYQEVEINYNSTDIDTSVLEALMPATILVNDKNEIWRTYGDCSGLLSIPTGLFKTEIFSLIRNDLKIAVSTALKDARHKQTQVIYNEVPDILGDQPGYVSMVAQPIYDRHGTPTEFVAISFIRESRKLEGNVQDYQIDTAAAQRISNLERELHVSQDNLSQTVTELESVNAELQAANEELLTANEELQSSNEELQSVNEELYTVNSEYQSKVNELAGVNNDMVNFLSTTLVGIMMVDKDLNIRKFTEYIATEFKIADQDVGRSLRYLSFNFVTIDLIDLCRDVLETMAPIEIHAASVTGRTYLIRIAPYLLQDHKLGTEKTSRKKDSADPNLEGLVLTFVDTTKQIDDQEQIEEMAQALRRAVRSGKEKDTFLSHMSHDMRTPMTAILGLLELSLTNDEIPDSIRENLTKIQASSRYLLSLIEEILETSRINAGKVVSICQTVKETDMLDEMNTIITEQAKEAGIHFHHIVNGCSNYYILADTEHVQRILFNILNNAIKFTAPGGDITFETTVNYLPDALVRHTYRITDTGRGMSEIFQNKMFQPFEQEHEEDHVREGTGLGLYICKQLTDLLGGTIECESKIGVGTTFTIEMTYTKATHEQIRLLRSQIYTYEEQLLYGRKILIAEDNDIVSEVIMKMLSAKGVHCDIARDGQEVIDIYRRRDPYHYQAILMDVRMPIKDGFTAAREIRQTGQEDANDIPIIALTADVLEDTENKCFEAGMNAFLKKPVDQDQLFHLLAEKIDK